MKLATFVRLSILIGTAAFVHTAWQVLHRQAGRLNLIPAKPA